MPSLMHPLWLRNQDTRLAVPQELKLAMPPREVVKSTKIKKIEWPRRRYKCRCLCGCKKRPGRLIPCPDCERGVGPGCCWSKETCHKCSWELVDQDATILAIAERKEGREVIMPQWTTVKPPPPAAFGFVMNDVESATLPDKTL